MIKNTNRYTILLCLLLPTLFFTLYKVHEHDRVQELIKHTMKNLIFVDHFYISKHNVTYGEYAVFTHATHHFPLDPEEKKLRVFYTGDQYPVDRISWNDAYEYCEWLDIVTRLPFSLPTDRQWRYVATNKDTPHWRYPTLTGDLKEGVNYPNIRTLYSQPGNDIKFAAQLAITSPQIACVPNGVCGLIGQVPQWVSDWGELNSWSERKKRIRGNFAELPPLPTEYENFNAARPEVKAAGFRCVLNMTAKLVQLYR